MDKKEQDTYKARVLVLPRKRVLFQVIGWGLVTLPTIACAASGPPPPPTMSQPEVQQIQSQSLNNAADGGSGVTDSNLNDSGVANGSASNGSGTSSASSSSSSSNTSSGIPTNFATLPAGSWVVGSPGCPCDAVNGNFVQSSDLLTSQQNLEQAILAVGKALNTGQMQQMSALEQEQNQVLQEQAQFQKNLLDMENVQYVKSRTPSGETATLNNQTIQVDEPGSLCNEDNMAANIDQGMVVNRKLAENFGQVLSNYNKSNLSAMATLKNLADAPTNTLSAASIFPTAMASSTYPTPSEAAQTIAHLTEPIPPVQLTAAQKKTTAGAFWHASEHAIQAKMSMSQDALATIAAWHQPTIAAGYFVNQWQAMRKEAQALSPQTAAAIPANPPGINANHMISPDGALNLMIQQRYANPSWYMLLAAQSMPGAIKDLTEMEAISLRTHWESLRMSEYLAGLSADEYAHEVVTPTNNALTHLNANAMAEKNGAMNDQP